MPSQAREDGRTRGRRDAQAVPQTAASTPSRSGLGCSLPFFHGDSLPWGCFFLEMLLFLLPIVSPPPPRAPRDWAARLSELVSRACQSPCGRDWCGHSQPHGHGSSDLVSSGLLSTRCFGPRAGHPIGGQSLCGTLGHRASQGASPVHFLGFHISGFFSPPWLRVVSHLPEQARKLPTWPWSYSRI